MFGLADKKVLLTITVKPPSNRHQRGRGECLYYWQIYYSGTKWIVSNQLYIQASKPKKFRPCEGVFHIRGMRKMGRDQKGGRKGVGEGKDGNTCHQAPWFKKTCLPMNGAPNWCGVVILIDKCIKLAEMISRDNNLRVTFKSRGLRPSVPFFALLTPFLLTLLVLPRFSCGPNVENAFARPEFPWPHTGTLAMKAKLVQISLF